MPLFNFDVSFVQDYQVKKFIVINLELWCYDVYYANVT